MRWVAAVVSVLALTLALSAYSTPGKTAAAASASGSGGGPQTLHHLAGGAIPHGQLLRVRTDDPSPPGCLAITGRPLTAKCEPCPPLWLGGPTIRCIPTVRYYALISATTSRRAVLSRPASGAGWLPGCAAVPMVPLESRTFRTVAWLCGSGFMTH